MINKQYLIYNTIASYEAAVAKGDIKPDSIVFVKEDRTIRTHGETFGNGVKDDEIDDLILNKLYVQSQQNMQASNQIDPAGYNPTTGQSYSQEPPISWARITEYVDAKIAEALAQHTTTEEPTV